jgi:glutamyl-tRNA reductase
MMEGQFKAISLSYKNAPLSIREKISLSDQGCESVLQKIQDITGATEAMVLSTCNRTEIYYVAEGDHVETLIKLLCIESGQVKAEEVSPYFQVYDQPLEAITHLFHVSIGLESQVIGDLQITNQVKRAYQQSADANLAGPFLHRLMHTIFFTNKRIVQETAFRDGAASVSYAAVELVEELVMDRKTPRILVVGLGEIGSDVVRNLKHIEQAEVVIANRTHQKAVELAAECGYQTTLFEHVWDEVEKADVVISAVSGKTPFFLKNTLEKMPLFSFKIFIDLSVPRSVEKSVEDIPGILVHNIDDIHNRATQALERRKAAMPQVKAIISGTIAEFEEWTKEMIFSPAIQRFKNALEQIRQDEIGRYMKQMDPNDFDRIDKITKNILNKIIKMPVLQLKAACKRGDVENLASVLNDLFNLEATKTPETKMKKS